MRPNRLALTGLMPLLLLTAGCVQHVDSEQPADMAATQEATTQAPNPAQKPVGVPTINPEIPVPNPLWHRGDFNLSNAEITAEDPHDYAQAESMELSRVLPAPWEVDSRFELIQNRGALPYVEAVAEATDPDFASTLAPFKEQYQGGAMILGRNPEDKADFALNLIARFDTPETAEAAAQALFEMELSSLADKGGVDASSNGVRRVEHTVKDSRGRDKFTSTEFATDNEYVLINSVRVDSQDKARAYQERFNKLAVQAVGSARTHEAVAGYGTTADYAPLDPTGLLRLTVEFPEYPGIFPQANYLTPQVLAVVLGSLKEMTPVLERAGVEAAAERRTLVFRAKDTAAASDVTAAVLGSLVAGGATVYPEPQEVPGTVCVEGQPDGKGQQVLTCVIQMERTIAVARSTVREGGPDLEAVRENLSELTATQVSKLSLAQAIGGDK